MSETLPASYTTAKTVTRIIPADLPIDDLSVERVGSDAPPIVHFRT